MRILFATTLHAHWGGSEWLWSDAALALKKRGHEVGYFQPWPKQHPALEALRDSGAVEFSSGQPVRWWRRLATRMQRPSLTFRQRMLETFKPDLVVISQARQDEGIDWHEDLIRSGIPYVVLNELVTEALYIDDDTIDRLSAFLLGASATYCVSRRNLDALQQQLGHELPNGNVQPNPFRVPYAGAFTWPDEKDPVLRLALVGRLDPDSKGHRVLLEALHRKHWRERSICLHFYGDGSSQRSLRRLVKWWGMDNQVFFEGHVPDVADIWKRCHVVAQPSREEGTPIAMLEGLLSGRPVLATAVAGIPEFVDNGQTGFLAPACTADLLDDALEQLWLARNNLREMGRMAQQRARERLPASPSDFFADRLEALTIPCKK